MKPSLLIAAIASACAVSAAAERPAAACSAATVSVGVTSPPNEATDVPTNTEIRVEYWSQQPWSWEESLFADVHVRPVGGAGQPIVMDRVRNAGATLRSVAVGRPEADLLPNTDYEIVTKLIDYCTDEPSDCAGEDFRVIGAFSTGDGRDENAPSFAGVTGYTSGYSTCDEDACCGPYGMSTFRVLWDAASGELDNTVRYHIYRDAVRVAPYVTAGRGGRVCSGIPMWFETAAEFASGSGRYTVHAVDMAGNEDDNDATADVIVECDPMVGTQDAGTGTDSVDAGQDASTDAGGTVEASGCSAARSGSSRWLLLVLLSVLSTARPRRWLRRRIVMST